MLSPPNSSLSLHGSQVDAVPGVHASGTLEASCNVTSNQHLPAVSACIDAGSTTGAPLVDFEGQPRDANPDIGPDEYVP